MACPFNKNPTLWIAVPETEQGLADAARSNVTISFTPHLMPMVRLAAGIPLFCNLFLWPINEIYNGVSVAVF